MTDYLCMQDQNWDVNRFNLLVRNESDVVLIEFSGEEEIEHWHLAPKKAHRVNFNLKTIEIDYIGDFLDENKVRDILHIIYSEKSSKDVSNS